MTNVQFTLSDFQLMPFKANIILTPNVNIQVSADSLIPNVPKKQWDDGTTVTFNCLPGIYIVNINGPQYNDESQQFVDFQTRKTPSKYSGKFTINVPETGGGTVNANTLIVDQCFTLPTSSFNVISASYATTAAYASSAGNATSASYAQKAGLPIVSTASYALSDGVPFSASFAHGYATTPNYVKTVLLCTNNDANTGIKVGQELDADCVFNEISIGDPIATTADHTSLYVTYDGVNGIYVIYPYNGVKMAFSSFSNFSVKIYWSMLGGNN